MSDFPGRSQDIDQRYKQLILAVLGGEDLSTEDAAWAMSLIMRGERSPAQIAGFLVALKAKGESSSEIAGLAQSMLEQAQPLEVDAAALDIVGTGGDGLNTLNISTMSSLVAAGAGVPVVKHGNRGASTASGAADVIEALGVNLKLSPELVARSVREVGITFCFAQTFHPSMRFAAPARKELAIPTAFNVLGPLTNPAHVRAHCIGVADSRFAPVMAEVLAGRDAHGFVVRGRDGRDKITITQPSDIWETRLHSVIKHELDPREYGMSLGSSESLSGKDPEYNATVVRELLAGKTGALRDAVLLNAAAGIAAYTWLDQPEYPEFAERMRVGIAAAAESIDSGKAQGVLANWVQFSSAQELR